LPLTPFGRAGVVDVLCTAALVQEPLARAIDIAHAIAQFLLLAHAASGIEKKAEPVKLGRKLPIQAVGGSIE